MRDTREMETQTDTFMSQTHERLVDPSAFVNDLNKKVSSEVAMAPESGWNEVLRIKDQIEDLEKLTKSLVENQNEIKIRI